MSDPFNTQSEFASSVSSEKVTLCSLDSSLRVMGWSVHSGSVYSASLSAQKIVSMSEDGSALTEVDSISSISAGEYYFDKENETLYLETTGSANPNSVFISATKRNFYSNIGVALAWDLSSSSASDLVEWQPILKSTSSFKQELSNRKQFGTAIEGQGSVTMINDLDYWKTRFDKEVWERRSMRVYRWNPDLLASEAKLIFRGRIQTRKWSATEVSFQGKDDLLETQKPVEIPRLSELSTKRIPDSIGTRFQRRIYGKVQGHRPQNIDQVSSGTFEGYPLTGTVDVSSGSTSVTGSGTSFLKELTPGDEVRFSTGDFFKVETVDSDTAITLADAFDELTLISANVYVKPSHPKRYINREFVVSHHLLREPTTTVSTAIDLKRFEVADATDFQDGDAITVGGVNAVIDRVQVDNVIKLQTSLDTPPSAGASVVRPAITNVFINSRKLILDQDYTVTNSSSGPVTIELDELAEFNAQPAEFINGTVTFNGTRTVTGSGTSFKSDLAPGDWIRARGEVDYFEILSIEDDTNLELRSAATYSASAACEAKKVEVYDEGQSVLSCDCLGLTTDDTISGTFIERGPAVVKDLLEEAGLSSDLDNSSFTESTSISEHTIGFVVPSRISDTEQVTVRDTIQKINQSVFGSLVLQADYTLAYKILDPVKGTSTVRLDDSDLVTFSVNTDASQIVKSANVIYDMREVDPLTGEASQSLETFTTDNARYLTGALDERTVETVLVDQSSASIFASRYAFFYELASTAMQMTVRAKSEDFDVTDPVQVAVSRIYERLGSSNQSKISAVNKREISAFDIKLALEDLQSAYTRVANITENDANDFSDAGNRERAINGYITDQYGMIDNDPETFGINVIF